MEKLLLFDKKIRKIEKGLAILSGVIIIFLMMLTTTEVFLRAFFNSTIPGSYEMTSHFFIGIVFLAVSYVQSVRGHISIDIFTTKLSDKNKRILDGIGVLIGLIIVVTIAWQTGIEAWKSFSLKEYSMGLVRIQLWPSKLAITFGLVLLSVRLLIDAIKLFSNIEVDYKENDESVILDEEV